MPHLKSQVRLRNQVCKRAPNPYSHKDADLVGAMADNQCDESAASPQWMIKKQTSKGLIPFSNGNESLVT